MFTHFLRSIHILIVLLFLPLPVTSQELPIDTKLAYQYFREMQNISLQDNGKLWGISFYGPMLFVDQTTRMIVANQADLEGNLTKQGEVFVGKLPVEKNIANTAMDWSGVKWTMIKWPLPEDRYDRARIMVHESFHRFQDSLGLPASNPANSHLDTREGRIWLQLEWRALREALRHQGKERRHAAADALLFRSYRHSLFKPAENEERLLEMSEGLAEYSGIKLSGRSDAEIVDYIANQLEKNEGKESYVRSFAYVSGPVYGILLDQAGADWRKNLKPTDDLGLLLQSSLAVRLPQALQDEATRRVKDYNGDALITAETERENAHQKRIAEYKARLVDGPVLIIPLQKMNVQFDPNNLQPLGDLGTVYPTIRITDLWGILTVTNGALLNSSWTMIYVPAPKNPDVRPLEGDGWALELNEGWKLESAEREGDFIVTNLK
ncbi:MAG: hypothetical protein WCE90_07770 [Candidatus Zixiibacteriota bacterium]